MPICQTPKLYKFLLPSFAARLFYLCRSIFRMHQPIFIIYIKFYIIAIGKFT